MKEEIKMSNSEQIKQDWSWVGRFVSVIVVALILAAAIGGMDLFTKTFCDTRQTQRITFDSFPRL